jgi:hypothetical protein
MKRRIEVTIGRKWSAALALLADLALSPSRAEASCGDYVMLGGQHTAHRMDSGLAAGAEHGSAGTGHEHKRCHGPSCSNRSTPPAAPVPQLKVNVERFAAVERPFESHLPQVSFLLAEPQFATSSADRLGIFRPPR